MTFSFTKIIAKNNAITRSFSNIDSTVDENIKKLFLLLILTSLTTLFLGNIFVMNMGVLKASGILWFVCFSIYLSLYGVAVLTGSFQFSLVFNVLLLVLLVRTQFYELKIILYILSLYGGYIFIRDISRDHINWYACLLLSGLGTLTIFGSYFYTNFDMLDRLYAGVVNQDTLYHASISSMIKTYGVVSTGINGLVETPYHVLSHTIIAAISKISGVSVIESYGFVPYLFFGPLLIMALVKSVPNLKEDMSLYISWFVACTALILLPQLLADWKVRTYHFTSESYMVSLVFLLSALPLLVQKKITTLNLVLIVLLGGLAAHAKASVGLLVFCLFCARILFISEPSLRKKEMIFAIIFAFVIYFTLSRSANSVANSGYISFQPFVFLLKYAGGKGYDDLRDSHIF